MNKETLILVCAMLNSLFSLAQYKVFSDTTYLHADTLIEIKSWVDLNSIREFKRIKTNEVTLFKNYDMDSKILREQGVFKKGHYFGIWKYYSESGKLEKEINFETNVKIIYGKINEPYDELFIFIKNKADSLLASRIGQKLFLENVILNAGRTYYYGKDKSGSWFEVPDFKPNEFLLRYDIRLLGNERFPLIEFKLDSVGQLKEEIRPPVFSNYSNQEILTLKMAEDIAINKGLSKNDKPFIYNIEYKEVRESNVPVPLALKISGKPYKNKRKGNKLTEHYNYILIDAWTGKFMEKGNETRIYIID